MFSRILLIILLCATSSALFAQPVSSEASAPPQPERPPLGPGGRISETFFNTLRDVRTHGAQELTFLLVQRSVREEVKLDEAGWKEFRVLHASNLAAGEKLYRKLSDKEIEPEELKTELSKIAIQGDTEALQMFEKHKITERLIGLYVQHRGASSAVNKLVADKIGLKDEQRHAILKKRAKVEREVFEDAAEDFRKSARNPDSRRKIWEKIQKKIDMAVSEELSSDQRILLEKLEGAPFKFEEPGRGPRPRDRAHEKECCDQSKIDAR